MRIISMYLPQFHQTKENDEWWGEGFTDWVSAKNAEPLYDGHYQPHIPLGKNYYNLMEQKVMQWQADLMKEYGIDAQCIYHYWFKDGKQMLEKPVENLLKWKEIDMPFCFCWANASWARTWSKYANSETWMTISNQSAPSEQELLLEQKYGGPMEWKEHFAYLLPFFKDQRYMKIDNKPLFVIYKTAAIPCLEDMAKEWNQLAIEQGFSGIQLIGSLSNHTSSKGLNAVMYIEPTETLVLHREKSRPLFLDYDEVWGTILSRCNHRENVIYSGIVGFDDTPRKGTSGVVVKGATPEKFRNYLSELIAKNKAKGNDLIFINAWNEWGEGMHLEPDEKHGYGYLEAVRYAREHYIEYLEKYQNNPAEEISGLKKEVDFWAAKCARYEGYWRALDAWLFMKEDSLSVADILQKQGIERIAIHGMGMLGKHLLEELKDTGIQIEYFVDKSGRVFHADIKTYRPDDELPETQVIVSTRGYEFSKVRTQLEGKGHKSVISLEELLLEAVQ